MEENQVEELRQKFEKAIGSLPKGFYDSFDFVTKGNNLCHPVTLGLLAKIVGEMDDIRYVGIDVRLNDREGSKFQPDIVGYRDAHELQNNEAVILIDFESPNSCDTRITKNETDPIAPGQKASTTHLADYLNWVRKPEHRATYVMVTSLPDRCATWELRYTSGLNREHRGRLKEICENPFQYWTRFWAEQAKKKGFGSVPGFSDVFFLNINGSKVITFKLLGPNENPTPLRN